MTDPTNEPWPVERGSLALAVVGHLMVNLEAKGVISFDDIAEVLRNTVSGAGDDNVQRAARLEISRRLPGLKF